MPTHYAYRPNRSTQLKEIITIGEGCFINTNARLYDPYIARMLSPDNFACPGRTIVSVGIQDATSTQGYNRYTYVLNNPLKYKDPSGELIGTIITGIFDFFATGFTKGGFEIWHWNKSYFQQAWASYDPTSSWSKTNKAWRIDKGLFKTDPHKSFLERMWQVTSRFTWEIPQTVSGNIYSHIRNISGNVTSVEYYGGATLVNKHSSSNESWGLTLGPYINSENLSADPYQDEMFRHEFGHVLQSQQFGVFYIPFVAVPSGVGAFLDYNLGINRHDEEWYEVNANVKSKKYFEKYESNALNPNYGGTPWNNTWYPIKYKFNWYTIPSIMIGVGISAAIILLII